MEGDDKCLLGLTREAVEHLTELQGGECINFTEDPEDPRAHGCPLCQELMHEGLAALASAKKADEAG